MANSAQARKRIRQTETHRQHNTSQRSEMRTLIKKTLAAINTSVATSKEDFVKAVSMIDRMANKKIIHKNKAARQKSRLNARLKKQATATAA
jgi:small subunit ribosomal protein S20